MKLISRNVQIPAWILGLCISIYVIGVFFLFTSDMQNNLMKDLIKRELITDKMMALSRNINNFGEFLIYFSFALMPLTWFAFIPLSLFMTSYWSVVMVKEEKSFAQKKGCEENKQITKRFIPYYF